MHNGRTYIHDPPQSEQKVIIFSCGSGCTGISLLLFASERE